MVELKLKVHLKWGEKCFTQTPSGRIARRSTAKGIIRQKTLPNRETFANHSSFKMMQVALALVIQTPHSGREETISGEARGPTKGWMPCAKGRRGTNPLNCKYESRACKICKANRE